VYETLEADSPVGMVPMIRNILGGFLFTGDDIYKKAAVLSGGERTRLAVARMLLRPANTLLLDEPTNHLDLDSKDVLLDALADFGGTLIFVSHDRYFVDRLATKIVEVGHGTIEIYPGTYEEFLWSKKERARRPPETAPQRPKPAVTARAASTPPPARGAEHGRDVKKRADAEARKRQRAADDQRRRIADLEMRVGQREQAIRDLEATMAAPGFYDDREAAQRAASQHESLMWEVGDLMNQWEALQKDRGPS
jgi:ATP-binding cassette subfamily F protein 3